MENPPDALTSGAQAPVVIPPDSPLFSAPNLLLAVVDATFEITEVLGDLPTFGLTRDQAIGRSVLDFIDPGEVERVISSYLLVAGAREIDPEMFQRARWLTVDLTLVTAVGERLPASVSVHPVGEGFVVLARMEPVPHIRHESLRRLAESTRLKDQLLAASELVATTYWFTGFVVFPPLATCIWRYSELPEVLLDASVWRPLLESGRTFALLDDLDVSQEIVGIARDAGLRAVWVFPLQLTGGDRVLGVMVAWSMFPNPIPAAGLDRLLEEARWIGTLAVAQQDTVHRLEHLATRDHLTDIPNRSGLEAYLRNLQGDIVVLYLDLDRFKEVNDRYGHSTGDAVLVEAARRVGMVVGEQGFVARLGGDEFCVVMAAGAEVDAAAVAIETALAEPVPMIEGRGVSVSIGASRRGPASAAWRLLREADEEMLQTKASRVRSMFRRTD